MRKENIISIVVIILIIGIMLLVNYKSKENAREDYEKSIVYCIASESSCTVGPFTFTKTTQGMNEVTFNLKPFNNRYTNKVK